MYLSEPGCSTHHLQVMCRIFLSNGEHTQVDVLKAIRQTTNFRS